MEFQDVIRKRRMVRAFRPDPLDEQTVERLLAAGNRAPSAGFSQGYGLLVLQEPEDREKFWALAADDDAGADDGFWKPLTRAPLIVVPLSNKEIYLDRYTEADKGWTDRDEAHWPVPFWHIDTGFVTLLILLAAVDEGLGALYFGIAPPDLEPVKAAFGVPADYTPIGAIAIGVPDEPVDARQPASGRTRKRRSLNDVVHRGSW